MCLVLGMGRFTNCCFYGGPSKIIEDPLLVGIRNVDWGFKVEGLPEIRHHTMPCHTMPCHAMPYHTMPCDAIPWRAKPCHAMSWRAMPCHGVRCHAMACDAVRCHAMPCDAKSLPTTTMLLHFNSFETPTYQIVPVRDLTACMARIQQNTVGCRH